MTDAIEAIKEKVCRPSKPPFAEREQPFQKRPFVERFAKPDIDARTVKVCFARTADLHPLKMLHH